MDAVETKKIGKYLIKIEQDEQPQSPDDWGNDDAFVVYDHRQFSVERKGFVPREIFDETNEKGEMMYDGHFVFVLYAYIHSGVALSVGGHNFPDARWDVSTTGFVLIKKNEHITTEEEALKLAESIVSEWNDYLSGNVYGYQIYDNTDVEDDEEGEFVDSCWGFYGDHENCMTEAIGIVEAMIENDKHGQLELEII